MILNNAKKRTNRAMGSYGQWVVQSRFLVLFLSLLLAALAASGVAFLKFKNDYRYFFSKENPQLINFESLQNIYTKNDNILLVLEPEGGEVFIPSVLDAVEDITLEAWKIPYVIRVDSITNFQRIRAQGDDLYVNSLVEDALRKSAGELAEIREIALAEPALRNRLISDTAHVTGVNVTLELPGEGTDEQARVIKYARTLSETIKKKHPGIEIYLSGLVALDNTLSEVSISDIKTLIPMMYLGIILTMIFLLRSVGGTFVTVCVIALSTLTAMGISGWLAIPITPPSAMAPTLIMTLAVADCIHILVSMFQKMKEGLDKKDAIVESLRINMQPVFLTSFTTAIGFFSMNFSDAQPLRDLGNISAIGVMAAFLYTVSFLPALMAILPMKVRPRERRHSQFMERFADFIIIKHRPVFWVTLSLVVFLAMMIPKNELNDQWVRYFGEEIKFRRDTDFINKNLTGIYQIEYSLGTGETNGISKPEYLAKVDKFSQWWRSQPNAIHVNSFTETMKRLNKSMHSDEPAYYRIPGKRELSAQYLVLYELSLPYGLDLNNQVNIDKSSTRFTVTMKDISTKELRLAAIKGESWLKENAPESMFSYGSGTSVMFSYISERNIRGMLVGTLGAIVLISLVLIVAFRSFRYGIISLIANIVPALAAFGLWGLFVGEVNMAISVVGSMTLGIVVDDTIHLLTKFIRARHEQNLNVEDAIRYAFSNVGRALINTSLVLFIGFMILSSSSCQLNSGMGRLSAITIIIALFADFFLLPTLLIQTEKEFLVPVEDNVTVVDSNPWRASGAKKFVNKNTSDT